VRTALAEYQQRNKAEGYFMFRHFIRVIIFMVIIISATVSAKPLELLTLQYPPYEFEEDGELKGFVVDIIHAVFQRMDQPINITLLPWARALQMIEDGEADAIFTAYKTPEREVFADYSNEILMPQVISLFVRQDSNITFNDDLAALSDYSFGAVRGVSYGMIFDEAVQNGIINPPDLAATGEINMEKLLSERFDILVSNKYGALYILQKMNALDQVRELKPEVESLPSYIAFSKKRNLSAVRDRFDEMLAELKADGTYDWIINHYFH